MPRLNADDVLATGELGRPRPRALLLLFIWLSLQGVGYLAAPILALIGEWELARGADREAAANPPVEQADVIAEAAFQVAPLVVGDSLPLGTRPVSARLSASGFFQLRA